MSEYVIELSKYFICGLMVLYTLSSFYAFRYAGTVGNRPVYIIQNILMFMIQTICFVNLVLVTRADYTTALSLSLDQETNGSTVNQGLLYLFLFGFVEIFLLAVVFLVPVIYEKCNRLLLNNMCMLLGIGLMMISRLSYSRAIKQYVIVLISLIISLFIPYIFSKVRFLKKMTWLYAAVGIACLSAVLILGQTTHGSNISVEIAGLTFQPSEFVKILFIFFLAGALWEDNSFLRVAITAVLAGIHVIVLVLSTDLGGALIFFIAYVLVVFVATGNYLYILAGAAGGSAAALMAYRLFSHVRIRVLAWQDPWSYIDDQGWQITQSLFAVGSGSWFGMGLLKGDPTKIPFVSADCIFSSICEELGVIFGVCLIMVCVSCFIAIMQIALRIHDRFYQLIVYGIGTMYIFQIFLTVGGGIKFIPLTGVTLPFISYGGSSIMSTMFMFFIIQGIYIRLQEEGVRRHADDGTEE
ncbi:MAG: FtsW/RodA/SpoVE family cell cycle protein [Clostridium sp.]|nr:FtsW/RodA/SpoVE family cell cycle protein [Acetatifactor muris]MCM1528261.1 FtsW/RodA/SpoVE family cell cycle protein [Bacteroides sp.]MCM1562286.1 FtsW/RodA/SpoVE family cell cycle protein [Clostridium sp.]